MELQSKESFLDDYVGGYLALHAEKLEEMDEDDLEALITGVESKANNLWEYFNKCKEVGKRIKAGQFTYGSIEYYEAFL